MVDDDIWALTGLASDGGFLCVPCLEDRIGRPLCLVDFDTLPELVDPAAKKVSVKVKLKGRYLSIEEMERHISSVLRHSP